MRFSAKSFFAGVIVATIGVSTVFAASGIKSALFNTNKVFYEGREIDITTTPMLSVIKEGETASSNYMPLRAVLEEMGYEVRWDGNAKAVYIEKAELPTPAANPGEVDVAKKIVGCWKSNIIQGTQSKFLFRGDGSFAFCTIEDDGSMTYLSKGPYKVDGIKLYIDEGSKGFDDDEYLEVFFFENGKGFYISAPVSQPIYFTPDDGDTSWAD